jgi:hypothetical protein
MSFDLSRLLVNSPLLSSSRPSLQIPELTAATDEPRPKRCCLEGCKKKLGLTDFPCKCGKIHCTAHRASEAHACTYDYKEAGKKQLLKTMSTAVVAKKVDQI